MTTSADLRAAATDLYRQYFAALLRGDADTAADLKVRADYLNVASVTGVRMPAIEALALGGR